MFGFRYVEFLSVLSYVSVATNILLEVVVRSSALACEVCIDIIVHCIVTNGFLIGTCVVTAEPSSVAVT